MQKYIYHDKIFQFADEEVPKGAVMVNAEPEGDPAEPEGDPAEPEGDPAEPDGASMKPAKANKSRRAQNK
ncbi:MAG: hypothetical protein NC092_00860 [Butyrivibrio sp.]|nr:hypothetical protein [Muribaculum sp.]MCM1551222.1 hypothetical protein [Butyrivibrio sp.]